MPNIYTICQPRPEVQAGLVRDDSFAADLALVIQGKASQDYTDPEKFFANTYPTQGLKLLLKTMAQRLSGQGGEINSVIRLDTQFGGGKTHALIGLIHALRAGRKISNISDFVDPSLLPEEPVKIAALVGEDSDPANGRLFEDGTRCYTFWGELAWQIGGKAGYELVKESDVSRTAPGTPVLSQLIGDKPCLILMDEAGVYLRKAEHHKAGTTGQFAAFLKALFKAIETHPTAAVVLTLAVNEKKLATDAFSQEQQAVLAAFAEGESVIARKATVLNPTQEDETFEIIRRRLFESIDENRAKEAITQFSEMWQKNRELMPAEIFEANGVKESLRQSFTRSFPFHPAVPELLTKKLSSLETFQRTRGMLRLLARTVEYLWQNKDETTVCIHPFHIDPRADKIKDELLARLQQSDLTPALHSDVVSLDANIPAVAEVLDERQGVGQGAIFRQTATTIFLHTLAHPEDNKGINEAWLRYCVAYPGREPAFAEQARQRFIEASLHLDDKPGVPLRFNAQPNLEKKIRSYMANIDPSEERAYLQESIKSRFNTGDYFEAVIFPRQPEHIPDDAHSHVQLIVIDYMQYEQSGEALEVPEVILDDFRYKTGDKQFRQYRNHLMFLVADRNKATVMRETCRRFLALDKLNKPGELAKLAAYQQDQVKEKFQKAKSDLAIAIQQAYRHMFFPYRKALAAGGEFIDYAGIDLPQAANRPGDGQRAVLQKLREVQKLLTAEDVALDPAYVVSKTMAGRGQISTDDLILEFRKSPQLPMLLDNAPLIKTIQRGIENEQLIYRKDDQVWGAGDAAPAVEFSNQAFAHTMDDARSRKLWPRPEPLQASFMTPIAHAALNEKKTMILTVKGGVPPYKLDCPDLPEYHNVSDNTSAFRINVLADRSKQLRITVKDTRGSDVVAYAEVEIDQNRQAPTDNQPVRPADSEMRVENALLKVALDELWKMAEQRNIEKVSALSVTVFNYLNAEKLHVSFAQPAQKYEHDCEIQDCRMSGQGIEELDIRFKGSFERLNKLRATIKDLTTLGASASVYYVRYQLKFSGGLVLKGVEAQALKEQLQKSNAGDALVEAEVLP